jgi:hypothetical protein
MHVRFQCECGKEVSVTEAAAGASLPCDCGRTIKVPALSKLRQLAAADGLPGFPSADYEQLPRPASPARAAVLTGCGALVFVLGVGLFLGNVTGLFPTFPCAGFVVTTVGAVIWGAGRAAGART